MPAFCAVFVRQQTGQTGGFFKETGGFRVVAATFFNAGSMVKRAASSRCAVCCPAHPSPHRLLLLSFAASAFAASCPPLPHKARSASDLWFCLQGGVAANIVYDHGPDPISRFVERGFTARHIMNRTGTSSVATVSPF